MIKKLTSKLNKAAIDHLATRYQDDYVRKTMKTGSYPHQWDVIIDAFKAGSSFKENSQTIKK